MKKRERQESTIKVALAGNPNCGKTTLFNALTGATAHVGNWTGVTVEKLEGVYRDKRSDIRVDIVRCLHIRPKRWCHEIIFCRASLT